MNSFSEARHSNRRGAWVAVTANWCKVETAWTAATVCRSRANCIYQRQSGWIQWGGVPNAVALEKEKWERGNLSSFIWRFGSWSGPTKASGGKNLLRLTRNYLQEYIAVRFSVHQCVKQVTLRLLDFYMLDNQCVATLTKKHFTKDNSGNPF